MNPYIAYILAGAIIVGLGWVLLVIPTVVIYYWRKK